MEAWFIINYHWLKWMVKNLFNKEQLFDILQENIMFMDVMMMKDISLMLFMREQEMQEMD